MKSDSIQIHCMIHGIEIQTFMLHIVLHFYDFERFENVEHIK